MKIVYLIHQFFPEFWTGTEKFVLRMSSMMQRLGHSVQVIGYSFYEDFCFDNSIEDIIYRKFAYKGTPVVTMRHKNIPENIHYAIGDNRMEKISNYLISTEMPDIVHVGHSMRISELLIAFRLHNIPYIITLTDYWFICPKVNLVNTKGNLCTGPEGGKVCKVSCPEIAEHIITQRLSVARDILFSAKKIVAPSGFIAGMFKKEFEDLDITIIRHGINHIKIKQENAKYEKLTFCYAGSFNHHKGVHILIEAFKMIKKDNVYLKVFGSGYTSEYDDKILNMAKKDKRIELCGTFSEEEIGKVLGSVDIIVIPSLCYESYSFILHEAVSCNIPVIVSKAGGMAEKIKDNVNGFTFQVGDVEGLKAAMENIINNPDVLIGIKQNMKDFQTPTVEQEAYEYNRIYTNITQ